MNQQTNTSEYGHITTLKELRFHRKLLSSKVEHQEAMILYKVQTIRENLSPSRLIYTGFQTAAARNTFISVAFKAFNMIRSILSKGK